MTGVKLEMNFTKKEEQHFKRKRIMIYRSTLFGKNRGLERFGRITAHSLFSALNINK